MRLSLNEASANTTVNCIRNMTQTLESTNAPAGLIAAAHALGMRIQMLHRFISNSNPGSSQIHLTDAETNLLIALETLVRKKPLSQHAILALLEALQRDESISPEIA